VLSASGLDLARASAQAVGINATNIISHHLPAVSAVDCNGGATG
jgi:hypothetical protein